MDGFRLRTWVSEWLIIPIQEGFFLRDLWNMDYEMLLLLPFLVIHSYVMNIFQFPFTVRWLLFSFLKHICLWFKAIYNFVWSNMTADILFLLYLPLHLCLYKKSYFLTGFSLLQYYLLLVLTLMAHWGILTVSKSLAQRKGTHCSIPHSFLLNKIILPSKGKKTKNQHV